MIRYDKEREEITQYQHGSGKLRGLIDNVIFSVTGSGNTLWLGTDNGLEKLILNADRQVIGFEHYLDKIWYKEAFSNQTVFHVFLDSQGFLWIANYARGLMRLNPKTDEHVLLQVKTDDPTGLTSNAIYHVNESRDGDIWISTFGGGLNRIPASEKHLKNPQLLHYQYDSEDVASISSNIVTNTIEDSRGSIWLSASGLSSLDREFSTFSFLGKEDGLPANEVSSVLEDESGRLWIGTTKGLSRYSPEKQQFRNFDVRDGFHSDNFELNSAFKGHSGMLYFGTSKGICAFFPDSIQDNYFTSRVVFTDLQLSRSHVRIGDQSHGRITLSKSILFTKEIVLSHQDNHFSIEFAALNYAAPMKNRYTFRLDGFDRDWIKTNASQRTVSYTNLNPGRYELFVKASNHDGIWMDTPHSIRIRILPPFWQTDWFRALCALVFILGAVGLHKMRVKKLEENRKRLTAEVAAQTRELDQAYDELLNQKKELERSNEELQQFAYVASHDLQEPLRMVTSYVTLLSKRYQSHFDDDGMEFITLVVDGVKRMRELIEGLLDYSRLSTEAKPFQATDTGKILIEVEKTLKILTDECNASIEYDALPCVQGDPIQISRLFQNIISNAIKYRGQKRLQVFIGATQTNGYYKFYIRDNGIGIDPRYYDRIFKIFQRLHNREHYSGTGIGLASCKKIVERHGGSIWVESEPGKGSTFYFTLPAVSAPVAFPANTST